METERLYWEDAYLKEWDAEIKEVNNEKFIVLDKSAFYPLGGGQPNDEGLIIKDDEEYKVVFTGLFNDEISHEVDKEGLKKGDKVKCKLDWERRYKLMRMHTAAHVLSAVFHKEAGALITGNQKGVEKSRIDFSLENYDPEKLKGYIEKANEEIQKNAEVKAYFLEKEEAEKIPGLFKLVKALPEREKLRVLEITGIDKQADGGTHVKNTSEIGKIVFLKAQNKGKNNRRLYFGLD